jgi:hypothetical protein
VSSLVGTHKDHASGGIDVVKPRQSPDRRSVRRGVAGDGPAARSHDADGGRGRRAALPLGTARRDGRRAAHREVAGRILADEQRHVRSVPAASATGSRTRRPLERPTQAITSSTSATPARAHEPDGAAHAGSTAASSTGRAAYREHVRRRKASGEEVTGPTSSSTQARSAEVKRSRANVCDRESAGRRARTIVTTRSPRTSIGPASAGPTPLHRALVGLTERDNQKVDATRIPIRCLAAVTVAMSVG